MKFTREYRFSPAIIIGRTSATVGLFLGYRSGIHKLFAIRARRLCYRIAYHPSVIVDDGRSSATVDFGVRCTPNEQHQGLWTCVTQFYSGSISENVLKTKKNKKQMKHQSRLAPNADLGSILTGFYLVYRLSF